MYMPNTYTQECWTYITFINTCICYIWQAHHVTCIVYTCITCITCVHITYMHRNAVLVRWWVYGYLKGRWIPAQKVQMLRLTASHTCWKGIKRLTTSTSYVSEQVPSGLRGQGKEPRSRLLWCLGAGAGVRIPMHHRQGLAWLEFSTHLNPDKEKEGWVLKAVSSQIPTNGTQFLITGRIWCTFTHFSQSSIKINILKAFIWVLPFLPHFWVRKGVGDSDSPAAGQVCVHAAGKPPAGFRKPGYGAHSQWGWDLSNSWVYFQT